MKQQNRFRIRSFHKAFTLTEMIVVITIIAILGAISFVLIGNWLSSARDAARVTDMGSLSKALEGYMLQKGNYPAPDHGVPITFSGGELWTQGTISDSVLGKIGIQKGLLDPKFQTEYTYSVLSSLPQTNRKRAFSIAGILEQDSLSYIPGIPFAFASDTLGLQAYVQSNFNSLVAKTSLANTCYTLALPTMVLSSIPTSGKIEDAGSGTFVFHKKGNLPSSYSGSFSGQMNGSFVFRDYGSEQNLLILSEECTLPTDPLELGIFADRMKTAFLNTPVESEENYRAIILTEDSGSRIRLGVAVINNYLGGNVQLSEDTPLPSFACATPHPNSSSIPNSAGYTIGLPNSFEMAWSYSATPGNCTFSCAGGYAWNGTACVLDQCQGNLSSLNGVQNGTQSYSSTWTYSTTPGICTYTCNTAQYTFSGATQKCEPNACSESTQIVGTSPDDHIYSVPNLSHGTSQVITSAPKSIPNGTRTYNQGFSCTLGSLSLNGAETGNAASCNTNYTWNGSACVANTQIMACSGIPANAAWNTASSITQTWNGSAWAPATTGVHNTTASTSECRFRCNTNYTWNGSACVDQTAPTISSVTSSSPACNTIRFTINGATDAIALHATPYSFDSGSSWQAGNIRDYTSTSYTQNANSIRVRDAAGNVYIHSASVVGNAASCSCSLPWGGTISHGSSVTAYQNSSVNYPSSCNAESRTCSNGTLLGSYSSQSCSVNYTYAWATGSWGSCSASCGSGSQSRTVYCQRSDGAAVSDGFCSGGKPATSQSCTVTGCYNGGGSCTPYDCVDGYGCGGTPNCPSTWTFSGAGQSGGCAAPYVRVNWGPPYTSFNCYLP